MSINWLEGTNHHMDEVGPPTVSPVFAGQKLVAVGGSNGMGRQTAADVVAAGAVRVPGRLGFTVRPRRSAG